VHKTNNVLNAIPKSVQPKAKYVLQEILRAEIKATAARAIDVYLATYVQSIRRRRRVCKKDREELLTFYEFPAPH